MKAKLEFDLADPDDKMEHMRCIKSLDMALALWEIQVGNFRKEIMRELDAMDARDPGCLNKKTMEDGVELVIERLRELLEEHNINSEDLII